MKIMQIGQLIGGLDIYIKNVVSNTSPDINYIMLYGENDSPQMEFFRQRGIRMYPISMHRALNAVNDLRALFQIIRLIKLEKPDVIHCHSAKGGFLGRIAGWITGVTTLYTPHAFSFLSTSSRIKRALFKLLERLAVLDSYLLACSESERDLGIREVGYTEATSKVWHNAISPTTLPADTDMTPSAIADNYICYMARPSYQKNPIFLIKVMAEVHKLMPDMRFCLLGVGYHAPDIDALKAGIQENGLTDCVDLHPWMSHDRCIEYIRQAKLYFTVSRYEGLSLTMLEAMSLGKAIIASDVIGNKDCVFDGENGYLLPFDEKLFAAKIVELAGNEELRKQLEANSIKIFREQFDIHEEIAKLTDIYANYGSYAVTE